MAKCFLCNRTLTNPAHAQRGYGDDCAKQYQSYLAQCAVTETEIENLLALNQPLVQRRLIGFHRALGKGRIRDAQQLLSSARREAEMPDNRVCVPERGWVTNSPALGSEAGETLAPVF